MLIQRPEYLRFLQERREKQVIKVVTGIRRCGKSTLFDLYRDFLKQDGVSDAQIIAINLEDVAFEDLHNYRALYDYVKARMAPDKMNYIFLDEIQHVEKYESELQPVKRTMK